MLLAQSDTYLQIVMLQAKKNSSNFKKGNIGMVNMHEKQRRQDRDGLVIMARRCSDIAPFSRYTNKPHIVAEVPQYNSYVYAYARYIQLA